MKQVFGLVTLLLALLSQPGFSQDTQWRGPDRSGIFPETGLLREWPENGPEMSPESWRSRKRLFHTSS
jgi:outer membrane protein assembly factor BamB